MATYRAINNEGRGGWGGGPLYLWQHEALYVYTHAHAHTTCARTRTHAPVLQFYQPLDPTPVLYSQCL